MQMNWSMHLSSPPSKHLSYAYISESSVSTRRSLNRYTFSSFSFSAGESAPSSRQSSNAIPSKRLGYQRYLVVNVSTITLGLLGLMYRTSSSTFASSCFRFGSSGASNCQCHAEPVSVVCFFSVACKSLSLLNLLFTLPLPD